MANEAEKAEKEALKKEIKDVRRDIKQDQDLIVTKRKELKKIDDVLKEVEQLISQIQGKINGFK